MRENSSTQKTLVVIAGPTAVGKTALALSLAQHLGTEIISADSRQCYQGMVIGTAQPTSDELALVPHHFVNCFPIQQSLTAADFERYALATLAEIFSRSNFAIVCGGTGLYLKALCEGLDDMPEVSSEIYDQVISQYKINGLDWLKEQLALLDPVFALNGEMQNPVRMLRALSFRIATGQSITSFRSGKPKERSFRIIKIALEMPRQQLYSRINLRVDHMMDLGLLQEVEYLYPFRTLKNLQTVGYAELFAYLNGDCSLPFAIDKIKQHSRNYAKRQMTWFKNDAQFNFFDVQKESLLRDIEQYLLNF